MLKYALTTALLGLITLPAVAQETPHAAYRETGSNQDWVGIYSPDRGTEKPTSSCAIYSRPKTKAVFEDGSEVEAMRGELAAFISWNGETPSGKSGEVSFMVGLPVEEGVDKGHVLTVDGDENFELAGIDDRLYVMPEDDATAIAAIRGGIDMVVTAKARDGRVVKDGYSLLGVQNMTVLSKQECR